MANEFADIIKKLRESIENMNKNIEEIKQELKKSKKF